MEPVHKSSKVAPQDMISNMPENVITNILNRLPIHNAISTSILSRNWRFKWTLLTQLVFDDNLFKYVTNLTRLFLRLKGPITKFVLYIPFSAVLSVEDISYWILFMSNKGIKEFVVVNMHVTPLKLVTHLFSCLDLTHLKLYNCSFHLPPSFRGFPNLVSLDLCRVTFESGNCREVITQCPLLETLKISDYNLIDKVKLVEIAQLGNLKVLSLPLCKLDNMMTTSSLVVQLGGYFPKLHELELNFLYCKLLQEDRAGLSYGITNSFRCLKSLALQSFDFSSISMIYSCLQMILGSPNLQYLSISTAYKTNVPTPLPTSLTTASTKASRALKLRSVVFVSSGSTNELRVINWLLASSPLLEKIVIDSSGVPDGKLILAKNLLMLHRASPVAEVEFR